MLVQFTTPTQPAGSIGGLTLYKSGDSFAGRARAYPKRVRSDPHTAALNLISILSIFWERPMTDAQRLGWGEYAFNSPLSDAYNAPKYIKGYAHYMRSNRPRLQHGLPRIDPPPTTFGLPTYSLPTFGADFATRTIAVSVTTADAWAHQDNAAMLLWISRPTQRARHRPPETYQPLGKILGSATTPPSGQSFPFPSWIPSTKCTFWIRSSVTDEEGRLSGL